MNRHLKIAAGILGIGILAVVVINILIPVLSQNLTFETSDARNFKGEISIALDTWIGYFPFQSPVFKKMMKDEEYRVKIINDNADYALRMQNLAQGKTNFAVCTVDSYIKNGVDTDYPGTIVLIIDESKGGDAIVSWKDKVDTLDKLKTLQNFKIAFTSASPSEHLLYSTAVHFGLKEVLESGDWRVETNGASEAYNKLIKKQVDAAVIWEPHVSNALTQKGIVKLLGSENIEKLIVDILLVNRNFAKANPDIVQLVIEKYFQTLEAYTKDAELLKEDIQKSVKSIKADQITSMLKGVQWINFNENIRWFGIESQDIQLKEDLQITIDATLDIFKETEVFLANPLPNQDPYTIINSSFIEKIYLSGLFGPQEAGSYKNPLEKKFPALTEAQWKKLQIVGSLKLRPITFTSGTNRIDIMAEEHLEAITNTISHYPNFRILVKGHTGTRGDKQANLILSQERATAVKEFLQYNYNMDSNRIRAVGLGGSEALKRESNESSRSYNDRLKRVEIYLLSL